MCVYIIHFSTTFIFLPCIIYIHTSLRFRIRTFGIVYDCQILFILPRVPYSVTLLYQYNVNTKNQRVSNRIETCGNAMKNNPRLESIVRFRDGENVPRARVRGQISFTTRNPVCLTRRRSLPEIRRMEFATLEICRANAPRSAD